MKTYKPLLTELVNEFTKGVKKDPFIVTSKLGNSFTREGFKVNPKAIRRILHVLQSRDGEQTQKQFAIDMGLNPNTLVKIMKSDEPVQVSKNVLNKLEDYFKKVSQNS